jgi:AraC family transcriptional regulator, exoenzyme S synthesis regulatory protein ExsA
MLTLKYNRIIIKTHSSMQSFFDFIKEHPPVKRLEINDLLLAEYQCPLDNNRFDIWSHHNYFIYVISGKKKWQTHTEEILVEGGDCLFVCKGAHTVFQFFDSEFCAIVLFVPDSFISSVLLENRIKTGNHSKATSREVLNKLGCGEELAAYFRSFYTYLSTSSPPSVTLMELKFRELIILSAVRGDCQSLQDYYASICHSGSSSLRDLMEANFNYPMNLEEYARLCHRSLSTFKRDFKSTFGTSPGKWLVHKRLELAKYLLENTDKMVLEAALDTGFKNHSHFSRIFRKKYGIAPMQLIKTREK